MRCGAFYSLVGNVPCLVPGPSFWRARTVQQLAEYLAFTARRIAELEADGRADGLLPRTRTRLQRIVGAMRVERALVENVLAPLRVGSLALPSPGAFSAEPMAGTLSLLTCYEHVFRDWAWGDEESNEALAIVERLWYEGRLNDAAPKRVAVFGAGAGRLAVDVHRALTPEQTLALDLSPLPLLIANRVARGEVMKAAEFPIAPRVESDVAVARQLRCPFPWRAGLTYLLADAFFPPFPPGSLDLVLTPWFIDAVDVDPRVTAATVNRVLQPGGLWINFGPLRFTGPTTRLYTIEEIDEIVGTSGFETRAELREQVPYFACPESGFTRLELVYGFTARKIDDAPPVGRADLRPAWLTDRRSPVPLLPEWAPVQGAAVVAHAVLSLVDGHRSISDIADALGPSWGIDPRILDAELQALLMRLSPQ